MKNSIVDAYFQRKIDNILEYMKIILKSIEDKKYMNTEKYRKIVEKYIYDEYEEREKISEFVNKFLNSNNITHYKLKNIINYVIKYNDFDLDINPETIIFYSKIILFSMELEIKTNTLLNDSRKYADVVRKVLENNKKLFDLKIKEKVLDSEKELKQEFKKNISDELKFLSLMKNDNFKITLKNILNTDKTKYYLSKFDYKIKALSRFKSKDVKDTIEKFELQNEFDKIEINNAIFEILKIMFKDKEEFIIFVEFNDKFLDSMQNIQFLNMLIDNPKIKKRICFKISYKNIISHRPMIQELRKQNFKFAISDIQNSNLNIGYIRDLDYIFANKEFLQTDIYNKIHEAQYENYKIIKI